MTKKTVDAFGSASIKVPFIIPEITKNDKKVVSDSLNSRLLTDGPKLRKFESIFAKFTGAKFAVGVSNGTAALHLSLKALGIGKGSEVIIPDITFVATASSVLLTGATPVLVDVDEDLNISTPSIKKTITTRTKAIIPVHFAGKSCKIREIASIAKKNNNAIIISPGPGTPEDKKYFGICKDVITELGSTTPILGVCLGHQGIIDCFGGKVVNAGNVRHGKTSLIKHYDDSLFNGVKNPFRATRYHSLVGDKTIIPDSLKITAIAEDDGEIMGVSHKKYLIEGVQFHPESIMTDEGKKILENFIMRVKND